MAVVYSVLPLRPVASAGYKRDPGSVRSQNSSSSTATGLTSRSKGEKLLAQCECECSVKSTTPSVPDHSLSGSSRLESGRVSQITQRRVDMDTSCDETRPPDRAASPSPSSIKRAHSPGQKSATPASDEEQVHIAEIRVAEEGPPSKKQRPGNLDIRFLISRKVSHFRQVKHFATYSSTQPGCRGHHR